ncbi:MAG: Uroporphyrinogen decarboxylase [Candidatus Dichloromethanomonas elyunquensis]|nr:MAG: Uroporphyrinogen decarboxylase [Candidatus Dichloromethanomonas elyunquensis]
MNSRERVFATLDGKIPDRVPVLAQVGDHAGISQGLTYDVMYKDARRAADAHLKALKRYKYDSVAIQVEPSWPVVEACGGTIFYPPDKYPWITKNPILTAEDIKKFKMPDFAKAPGSKVMVEGTKILAESTDVPVGAYVTGPFTFSMQLFPYENFIKSVRNKEFMHALIQKSTEVVNAYAQALKEAGASFLVICEHDLQMFAPATMTEFFIPYLKQALTYKYNILHMCGKMDTHLDMNGDALADMEKLQMVSLGHHTDMLKFKKKYAGKLGFAGNLDHIVFLPQASAEEVEKKCGEIISAAKEGGQYMLSPGCEITSDIPPENVEAMVRAAEKFGRYA